LLLEQALPLEQALLQEQALPLEQALLLAQTLLQELLSVLRHNLLIELNLINLLLLKIFELPYRCPVLLFKKML
jgi:hypothetical protein